MSLSVWAKNKLFCRSHPNRIHLRHKRNLLPFSVCLPPFFFFYYLQVEVVYYYIFVAHTGSAYQVAGDESKRNASGSRQTSSVTSHNPQELTIRSSLSIALRLSSRSRRRSILLFAVKARSNPDRISGCEYGACLRNWGVQRPILHPCIYIIPDVATNYVTKCQNVTLSNVTILVVGRRSCGKKRDRRRVSLSSRRP